MAIPAGFPKTYCGTGGYIIRPYGGKLRAWVKGRIVYAPVGPSRFPRVDVGIDPYRAPSSLFVGADALIRPSAEGR